MANPYAQKTNSHYTYYADAFFGLLAVYPFGKQIIQALNEKTRSV
jgi:hypothetical protein